MTATSTPSPDVMRAQRRRAIVASTVGTTIEWYDFFLYSTAAALIFPKLFFPSADPSAGILLAFGTQFVGFAARPIGAAIFGHYGDRIGRKATLVSTLLIMGISTALIGVLPGLRDDRDRGAAAAHGAAAAAGRGGRRRVGRLGAHRDGVGRRATGGASRRAGRSWVCRWGCCSRRAWCRCSPPRPAPDFDTWGWRIPFLLSLVLVAVGLYVRLKVLESPEFSEVRKTQAVAKLPVIEAFRTQWREILAAAFVRMSEQAPFYLFITFVLTYGTAHLKLSRGSLLNDTLVAAAVGLISVPLFGHLSDKIGRRTMYAIGIACVALFAFPYFGLLNTKEPALVLLAIVLSLVFHDMQYGPQAALIAESFGTNIRYSGAGIGYQLASVIAGGPAPLIAAAILAATGSSTGISIYILICCALSFLALAIMPRRSMAEQPPLTADRPA